MGFSGCPRDITSKTETLARAGFGAISASCPRDIASHQVPINLLCIVSCVQASAAGHLLALIQVLPVDVLLNVSHPLGCEPKIAFIAFETRLYAN